MTTVFDVLRQDHNEVKAMLTRLEAGPKGTAGAGEGQLAERKRLVDQLIMEEVRHEAAEQQHFWPALRNLGADGERIADEALEQEKTGESILDELDKLSPDNEEFDLMLARFTSDARAHIAFEEAHAWPLLETSLTGRESEELGDKITRAKKMAPTRPHPSVPPQPGAQKAAGTMAAAADKLRDAVTGRGRHK
jgi:hypothetical protein